MRAVVEWLARVALAVFVLVVVAAGTVYAVSGRKLARTYDVGVHVPMVPADSASVAEGWRLARTWGCTECHGEDLGGGVLIDAQPMGTLAAPNLTSGSGGVGASYTREDWVRAIRHGIGGDGRGLLIMPSQDYIGMADRDLGTLVAYLETLPPLDRELPERALGPVARVLVTTGAFALAADVVDHDRVEFSAPARGPTAEYGRYLAQTCAGCHGPDLSGGLSVEPGMPPSANLTSHAEGLAAWSLDDFARALRQGRRPDGTEIDASMPWRAFAHLEDDEVEALWRHLQTLPPVATGGDGTGS